MGTGFFVGLWVVAEGLDEGDLGDDVLESGQVIL